MHALSRGVGFPDPQANGSVLIDAPKDHLNGALTNPANKACQHLLPKQHSMTAAPQRQLTVRVLKYVACMRAHGLPNFPDPNSQGAISVGPGSGIDPSSPKFQAAQKACQSVLPNGGPPTPQQLAKMEQKALAFSACMRKHGLPDFPDPQFSSGGGIGIRIRLGGPNSDLNPSSPVFQAAQKACRGIIGKPPG